MKKFYLLTKTLLVAALLMVGANAWADTQTVTVLSEDYEGYDAGDIKSTMTSNGWTFQNKNAAYGYPKVTIVQGEAAPNTTKYLNMVYSDGGAERNQYWTLPSSVTSALNADNWTLTFDAALAPGNNSEWSLGIAGNSSSGGYNANTRVTSTTTFLYFVNTIDGTTKDGGNEFTATVAGNTYSDNKFTLESDTWYKFTVAVTNINTTDNKATVYVKITSSDGGTTLFEQTRADVSTTSIGTTLKGFTWYSPKKKDSKLMLDNVLLTKEVDASTCSEPTSTITGVAGTSRKFTLTCETPASTIYYSETEKAYGDDGWVEYSGEVTTAATTIYMYAATANAHSSVTSFATGAGTEVVLNDPVMSGLSLAENDAYYTPTYTFVNGDNSGLIGSPSATLTATFNDTPLLGFSGTFTPTQDGTLVVTSSADGYASSQISVNCYVRYSQFWQSVDYSTLTEAEMTESYPTWTKSESGRWASWKETGGNYTYYSVTDGEEGYGNFTFDNYFRMRRNVLSLVEGFGIGRNITGSEDMTVVGVEDNDIVALKIYNGYGNSTAAEANYTVCYLRNGANVTYGLNNGKLLMQGTIYRPLPESVPATVTSAGWATFSSAYAVSIPDGVEAYAAKLEGDKVTLTQVDAVPANTGVILKAAEGIYNLPVVASADPIDTDLNISDGSVTGDESTIYVLGDGKNGVGFYWLKSGNTLEAGKAYLEIIAESPARGFIGFDGATGINEVNVNKAAVAKTGKIYNLNGQIVSKPSKGLFIVDGKVVSF